jgi:hypothetical protein
MRETLYFYVVVPRRLPAAPFLVRRRCLIMVPRLLPAAPLAVRRTHLIVVFRPVLRQPAATRRCRIRSLWNWFRSQVRGRGAQAGAQTAACGHAMLPQQEKNTRYMRR